MPTHEWSRHANAIEDAREAGGEIMLERALHWAEMVNAPELNDYRNALALSFCSKGKQGCADINRALEIIIDAYLTEFERRVA